MSKEKFLKLTNTVYKLLEFFPESDPLKNRAKDKALAIMEHLVLLSENSGWASFQNGRVKSQLLEDIEILLGYFWIAKNQGWVNSSNCLIIANEYEKVKKEIEPVVELTIKLPGIDQAAKTEGANIGDKEAQPYGKDHISATSVSVKAESPAVSSQATQEHIFGFKDNSELNNISDRQKKIIEFLGNNQRAQVMDLQKILPDVTKRTIRRDLDELLGLGKIARSGDFNQVFYHLS